MKKFICKLLLLMLICYASEAGAEIRNYIGNGEYIMSEFETLDIAKQRAKQKAERAAQEQAGVFVSSYTKVTNHQVTEDEVVTMTGGILHVTDVQYKLTPLEDGKSVLVSATVNVKIDSADVDKWLDKNVSQQSQLLEVDEDNIISLCTQAVELTTNYALAQYNRVVNFIDTNVQKVYNNIHNDNQSNGYTGVVIDASGLGLETTFSPVIYDTQGREIYGIENLNEEIVMDIGMVSYSTSTDDATITSRAGNNPLVVKAVEVCGGNNSTNKVNAVISVEDANKILKADRKTHLLDRCAVVFIK